MAKFVTRIVGVVSAAVGLVVVAAAAAYAAPKGSAKPQAAAGGPNPKPGLPAGIQTKLDHLLGMGMSFVIVACVAGVLICAGSLALAMRRGEGGEAAGKLGGVGFACILVASAAGIVKYLTA